MFLKNFHANRNYQTYYLIELFSVRNRMGFFFLLSIKSILNKKRNENSVLLCVNDKLFFLPKLKYFRVTFSLARLFVPPISFRALVVIPNGSKSATK